MTECTTCKTMFYIISIVFSVIGILILSLFKFLDAHFRFFNEHQDIFVILFAMLFVFLYNYCIYDYRPQSKIIYISANLIIIIIFILADKIFTKSR